MRNVTHVLIETVVRRTLKDIQDSPKRSIRNLVDMALNFSEGRFQQQFFEVAQSMLQNEQSPYYALIQDVAAHVDTERLVRFGMNLGYNGCTVGAKRIRELEKQYGYNIPWTVALSLDIALFMTWQQRYHEVIAQGEEMGVYVWQLICEKQAQPILTLPLEHPDSAFILYCPAEEITDTFLDMAAELNNLMIVVRYDGDETAEACVKLRERGLLYSLYFTYKEADMEAIRSGDFFCGAQQLHPAFTALLAESGCPAEVQKAVYECIEQDRRAPQYETILWETVLDSSYVDGIISGDACTAGFDPQGQMYALYARMDGTCFNLFENNLSEIFKAAFPKKEGADA